MSPRRPSNSTPWRATVAAVLLLANSARAADLRPLALRTYPSKYYVLHTDLPEPEAREALLRTNRVAEEYLGRTTPFAAGPVKAPMPLYLYKEIDDYLRAGGIDGSGGVFDGNKLMAVTLRRPDGVISLSTWHIVQHEGFHQFVHAAMPAGALPMWADEGLAEYFGQGLFTGDNFQAGLIPNTRLIRLQAMLRDDKHQPLARFTALTREEWNERVEPRNYDQAWSLVHFLAHADGGRLRPAFEAYMRDVSRGGASDKSFAKHLAPIPSLEARWRDWWLTLPDHPTADLYDHATLEILTSFLARAHAQGQRFESFDALVRTPPFDLKQPAAMWLPPTLFGMAVAESQKIRTLGGTFALVRTAEGPPVLLLAAPNGAKLAGRFTLTPTNTPENIHVQTLANAPQRKPPSTARTTSRPTGEMLRVAPGGTGKP